MRGSVPVEFRRFIDRIPSPGRSATVPKEYNLIVFLAAAVNLLPSPVSRRTARSHAIMYSAFMQYNEVFVTGGTGLLGRHVCRALVGHGFLPRLFVRTGRRGGSHRMSASGAA
jgi:hypothetical protein